MSFQRDFHNLKKAREHMEKQASILGTLGLGALIHMTPNVVMKAVKNTEKGHDMLAGAFSAGVDMGRSGRKLKPVWENGIGYGIGPETLVEMKIGQDLGSRIQRLSPENQERLLNKIRGIGQVRLNKLSPEAKNEITKTPIINSLAGFVEGRGENGIKEFLMNRAVPMDYKPPIHERLINPALTAGAAAVDPHLLMQPGISWARKKISESPLGTAIITSGFEAGKRGKTMSKGMEMATDMLVSPSVLDPMRLGSSMRRNLGEKGVKTFDKTMDTLQKNNMDFVTPILESAVK